jgi:hypothetical protein
METVKNDFSVSKKAIGLALPITLRVWLVEKLTIPVVSFKKTNAPTNSQNNKYD